jgi:hypothetical protein
VIVDIERTTRHYIPKDRNLQDHRCENFNTVLPILLFCLYIRRQLPTSCLFHSRVTFAVIWNAGLPNNAYCSTKTLNRTRFTEEAATSPVHLSSMCSDLSLAGYMRFLKCANMLLAFWTSVFRCLVFMNRDKCKVFKILCKRLLLRRVSRVAFLSICICACHVSVVTEFFRYDLVVCLVIKISPHMYFGSKLTSRKLKICSG